MLTTMNEKSDIRLVGTGKEIGVRIGRGVKKFPNKSIIAAAAAGKRGNED